MSETNKWYKFDFHTHTPASNDYRESLKPSPEEWLRRVMEAGLDCVAITDHNSGGWVDELKSAYTQLESKEWFRPLVLFPGCEITVSLGSTRIHLLALFDPSATKEDVTRFLGSCSLKGDFGDPENCFTTLSIESVTQKIKEAKGIAIPAHIDGVKGLLHNITNTNPDIKEHLTLFQCAQFIDNLYSENEVIHPELRKDVEPLAKVRGSDAHTLQVLGSSFSWIKMGSPTLDGLSYALKDHLFCVLNQDNDPNTIPRSYIKELTIKKMRHCGINPQNIPQVKFHPLFNCIIGGRGTGKSTFLEALRLSLGRSQDTEELSVIHEDIKNFVSGVTTPNTEIDVTIKRNASDYRAKWTKEQQSIDLKKLNGADWDVDEGNIKDRFPVNIYSQKQINALATNPNSLLEIVDRSHIVNYSDWEDRFNEKRREYLQLCSDDIDLTRNIEQEGDKRSKLAEVVSDIDSFESGGHNKVLQQNQLVSSVEQALLEAGDISNMIQKVNEITQLSRPRLDLSNCEQLFNALKIDLEAIQSVFDKEIEGICEEFEKLKTRLNKAKLRRDACLTKSNWAVQKSYSEKRYIDTVADYHARGIDFKSEEYQEWIQEKTRIEKSLTDIEDDKDHRSTVASNKEKVFKEIIELRSELQNKRQQFISEVLDGNEYVKMNVLPFSDVAKIEKNFRELIGKDNESFSSVIYDADNDKTLLYGLINSDKNSETKIREHSKLLENISKIVSGKELDDFKNDKRFNLFLKERYETQPEFLARLACWLPDDYLEVRYSRNGDGKDFTSINRASAGQKAAAILAFLLSHGDTPIIIDQPEDDLDNALVYSLIVKQIQSNKKRRQIIIVTHNPNIVVNGDAELVHVMEFKKGQVKIKMSGSLIDKAIRDEVCEIMEGGREAFNKRFQRIA